MCQTLLPAVEDSSWSRNPAKFTDEHYFRESLEHWEMLAPSSAPSKYLIMWIGGDLTFSLYFPTDSRNSNSDGAPLTACIDLAPKLHIRGHHVFLPHPVQSSFHTHNAHLTLHYDHVAVSPSGISIVYICLPSYSKSSPEHPIEEQLMTAHVGSDSPTRISEPPCEGEADKG